MKNVVLSSIIVLLFAVFGCQDQNSVLESDFNDSHQLKSLSKLAPPTSFSVSPSSHSNMNQIVSMTWNASPDTNVTGYKIYRGKYSYNHGDIIRHNYSLIRAISSRTVTSWSDTRTSWGTGAYEYIGYFYKIEAVSSTTGQDPSYGGMGESYLDDYYGMLP